MCGIAGIVHLKKEKHRDLKHHLSVMNSLQKHRGPDGQSLWIHPKEFLGFAHQRLSIIDLHTGSQPMSDVFGRTICYNGEIYNYLELKEKLEIYPFKTTSDTEVILAAYHKWGDECVNHLRGMFSFAIWDEKQQKLFCARDRFGIKPFFYTYENETLYFASEVKTFIPFLSEIKTNTEALHDYLVFQLCLGTKTLFQNVHELLPAHTMTIQDGACSYNKYWEVYYHLDFDHTEKYFEEHLRWLIEDSIRLHTRSDVPIGAYVSGGIDSSIISSVASEFQKNSNSSFAGFTGSFKGPEYDESQYARALADKQNMPLHHIQMTSQDFVDTIQKVIYHLDFPVAGPGSFPQYHVAKLAAQHRKVVLGGQGGDEIFGGYTRYLIAYFEQCIKAAIDGTNNGGNFIVTYESIIPNLQTLRNYKPMLKEFWREGLFEEIDKRYFRLINRAPTLKNEINWDEMGSYSPFETFRKIFYGNNVGKESYFDLMTHFDFKTLLPALLHVEDRMSMAHGIESRVPFLDHPLVEFSATMPSNIKFKDGTLKKILINSMKHTLPEAILHRKDKMGFPVPINEWATSDLKSFLLDTFGSSRAKTRPFFNQSEIIKNISHESKFGRKIWGLLSLELWYQQFHDRSQEYKQLISQADNTINQPTLLEGITI